MDADTVRALSPVLLLLGCGIATMAISRATRLSPIVGYLAIGIALKAVGWLPAGSEPTVRLLANLGVVFLLFDIGLHFSIKHVRERAADIFLFGPTQIAFGTFLIAAATMTTGLSFGPALLLGATLALSSTAVVGPLIARRHQQSCPVGQTATAILIFQDVVAIFLLVIAGVGGRQELVVVSAILALSKAAAAFAIAILAARWLVGPLLSLTARTRHEEAFTTLALFIALAAAWGSAKIGLSLTLGAFLGGMALAETPYRAVIQSEIKPFRGLLLGFFFIFVGLSLDVAVLAQHWMLVVLSALALIVLKVLGNAAASLVFRWSAPGSMQLGFLIAQGSEFAFVILSMPAVQIAVGHDRAAIAMAAVAISLGVTPNVAAMGRLLASRVRARVQEVRDRELQRREAPAPVLVVGMGRAGRTLADALIEFDVGYMAIERDQRRLGEAVADGYIAMFGDMADPRLWTSVVMGRKISALTAANYDVSQSLTAMANVNFPHLVRIALVKSQEDADRFRALGLQAVVDRSIPPGLDLASVVLCEMGIPSERVTQWMRQQQERSFEFEPALAVA